MTLCQVHFLLIYICNFHVLSNLLLIYIRKLHWNFKVNRPSMELFKSIFDESDSDNDNDTDTGGDLNKVKLLFLSQLFFFILQLSQNPNSSQLYPIFLFFKNYIWISKFSPFKMFLNKIFYQMWALSCSHRTVLKLLMYVTVIEKTKTNKTLI